jgi:hypothetical protein
MEDVDDAVGMQNAPTPKKKSKTGGAVASAGRSLNESSVEELRDQSREAGERSVPSYKRGGTKRGKGKARLHRNEEIMAPKMKSKRKKGRMGGRS